MHAQNVQINPKIGIGFFGFNSSTTLPVTPKTMFTIGSDFRFGSGAFFFNTGLHYSKDAYEQDNTVFTEKGSLNFLRVPLNVGLFLTGRDGLLSIFVKGGLTNNIKLSKSGLASTVSSDLVSTYNVAGNLGLGVELFKFLQVTAEYDRGFNNYFNVDPIKGKKGAFLFSLGLVF